MQPMIVVPLLIAVSTYIFIASLIYIFGSDVIGRSKVSLVLAAVCSAPGVLLVAGVSISSNDLFANAAYIFFFVGPFIVLFAIGFFLAGRIGIGGWGKDALAMVFSFAFWGVMFLLATTNF